MKGRRGTAGRTRARKETMSEIDIAMEILKRHEGYRQFPYDDTRGILSVGYGRNMATVGISEEEAAYLLGNDIQLAANRLSRLMDCWSYLTDLRRAVLIDMAVNMGVWKLLKFKKMLAALRAGDYQEAAAQILDSEAAKQTGTRYKELAAIMAGTSAPESSISEDALGG